MASPSPGEAKMGLTCELTNEQEKIQSAQMIWLDEQEKMLLQLTHHK